MVIEIRMVLSLGVITEKGYEGNFWNDRTVPYLDMHGVFMDIHTGDNLSHSHKK